MWVWLLFLRIHVNWEQIVDILQRKQQENLKMSKNFKIIIIVVLKILCLRIYIFLKCLWKCNFNEKRGSTFLTPNHFHFLEQPLSHWVTKVFYVVMFMLSCCKNRAKIHVNRCLWNSRMYGETVMQFALHREIVYLEVLLRLEFLFFDLNSYVA